MKINAMNTVSMKQLRENFASLKEKLERGEDLTLIYRSQPLAKLISLAKKPAQKRKSLKKKNYAELVKKLSGGLKLGKTLTPEKMNKILNERYQKMLS